MNKKNGINQTKLLMENWDNYLGEAGLADTNRSKIAQLLQRLGGKDKQEPGDTVNDPDNTDPETDASVADGEDDDALVPLSDEEIKSMIQKNFTNVTIDAFNEIKDELKNTLRSIFKHMNAQTSGLDIGDDHRLAKTLKSDKKAAVDFAVGMLKKLKTGIDSALSNQPQGNRDPGDLAAAAAHLNQTNESVLSEAKKAFKSYEKDLLKPKRLVIEIKK